MAGIEDGIRNCPWGLGWILSDSKAAIAAVANAGRTGRPSTGSLANTVARMVYRIRRREEVAVKLSWVKGIQAWWGTKRRTREQGGSRVVCGKDHLPRAVFRLSGRKHGEPRENVRASEWEEPWSRGGEP